VANETSFLTPRPLDRERTNGGLRSAISGGESTWTCEYRFQRVDGAWAYDDRATLARDPSGSVWRVIGQCRILHSASRPKLPCASIFTGRTLEQGHGWTHPDDLDRCFAIYSSAVDARRTFRDARRTFQIEYRARRAYRCLLENAVLRFGSDGIICQGQLRCNSTPQPSTVRSDCAEAPAYGSEELDRACRNLHSLAGCIRGGE
jgi:hypothetical protein